MRHAVHTSHSWNNSNKEEVRNKGTKRDTRERRTKCNDLLVSPIYKFAQRAHPLNHGAVATGRDGIAAAVWKMESVHKAGGYG